MYSERLVDNGDAGMVIETSQNSLGVISGIHGRPITGAGIRTQVPANASLKKVEIKACIKQIEAAEHRCVRKLEYYNDKICSESCIGWAGTHEYGVLHTTLWQNARTKTRSVLHVVQSGAVLHRQLLHFNLKVEESSWTHYWHTPGAWQVDWPRGACGMACSSVVYQQDKSPQSPKGHYRAASYPHLHDRRPHVGLCADCKSFMHRKTRSNARSQQNYASNAIPPEGIFALDLAIESYAALCIREFPATRHNCEGQVSVLRISSFETCREYALVSAAVTAMDTSKIPAKIRVIILHQDKLHSTVCTGAGVDSPFVDVKPLPFWLNCTWLGHAVVRERPNFTVLNTLHECDGAARPESRREGAIRATLTRMPSVSSLLRARRAVFLSVEMSVEGAKSCAVPVVLVVVSAESVEMGVESAVKSQLGGNNMAAGNKMDKTVVEHSCVSEVKKRGRDTGDSYTLDWRLIAPTRKACSVYAVTLYCAYQICKKTTDNSSFQYCQLEHTSNACFQHRPSEHAHIAHCGTFRLECGDTGLIFSTKLHIWKLCRLDLLCVETVVNDGNIIQIDEIVKPSKDTLLCVAQDGKSSGLQFADLQITGCSASLASIVEEPGSNPGGVAPGFSHVGNSPDDVAGRRVFSGIFGFLPPLRCPLVSLNTLRSAHIYWLLRQIRRESPIPTTARTPVLLVSVLELTIVLFVHVTPDTILYFTARINTNILSERDAESMMLIYYLRPILLENSGSAFDINRQAATNRSSSLIEGSFAYFHDNATVILLWERYGDCSLGFTQGGRMHDVHTHSAPSVNVMSFGDDDINERLKTGADASSRNMNVVVAKCQNQAKIAKFLSCSGIRTKIDESPLYEWFASHPLLFYTRLYVKMGFYTLQLRPVGRAGLYCASVLTPYACKETCIAAKRDWTAMAYTLGPSLPPYEEQGKTVQRDGKKPFSLAVTTTERSAVQCCHLAAARAKLLQPAESDVTGSVTQYPLRVPDPHCGWPSEPGAATPSTHRACGHGLGDKAEYTTSRTPTDTYTRAQANWRTLDDVKPYIAVCAKELGWLDYSLLTEANRVRFTVGSPPGFSLVGIVPEDTTGWRVFSEISRFPRTCIPASLHTHIVSLSSGLKISTLIAIQISPLTQRVEYLTIKKEQTSSRAIAADLASKAIKNMWQHFTVKQKREFKLNGNETPHVVVPACGRVTYTEKKAIVNRVRMFSRPLSVKSWLLSSGHCSLRQVVEYPSVIFRKVYDDMKKEETSAGCQIRKFPARVVAPRATSASGNSVFNNRPRGGGSSTRSQGLYTSSGRWRLWAPYCLLTPEALPVRRPDERTAARGPSSTPDESLSSRELCYCDENLGEY
ncbi:hypothetical protein PR048_032426 [Dryococelus australis]|uniref:Uncharacterized protein n=1 Tax=Dryococelus australis TaxID=614101 RepID=A0ABQ9G3C0_9NEOP|nr:hypothetical protein PR048_032426 [Dryococelus australis]